jgi:hypothetical protein
MAGGSASAGGHPNLNLDMDRNTQLVRRLRWLTALFIGGLVLSGATAIPLETELNWMADLLPAAGHPSSALAQWLGRVQTALHQTNANYPFIAYGADWLAFGHFMIALAFVWAWRDPVRNRWLYDFGLLACSLVVPYAMVMGGVRGIPLWWRLVDCSFGVLGALPLWLCRGYAGELAENRARRLHPAGT